MASEAITLQIFQLNRGHIMSAASGGIFNPLFATLRKKKTSISAYP